MPQTQGGNNACTLEAVFLSLRPVNVCFCADPFEEILSQSKQSIDCVHNLRDMPVASWAVPTVAPPLSKATTAANFYSCA